MGKNEMNDKALMGLVDYRIHKMEYVLRLLNEAIGILDAELESVKMYRKAVQDHEK